MSQQRNGEGEQLDVLGHPSGHIAGAGSLKPGGLHSHRAFNGLFADIGRHGRSEAFHLPKRKSSKDGCDQHAGGDREKQPHQLRGDHLITCGSQVDDGVNNAAKQDRRSGGRHACHYGSEQAGEHQTTVSPGCPGKGAQACAPTRGRQHLRLRRFGRHDGGAIDGTHRSTASR